MEQMSHFGMIANYHTHTYRCGHARGADREYVETAILRGLKVLGFSEHVPMPFVDGHESGFRVPRRLLEDYVLCVLDLKKEYAGDIEIHLGFEAEYYPDLWERMKAMLSPYPVEYLILGQHFPDSREVTYGAVPQSSRQELAAYAAAAVAGMRSGHFSYLAHPDLFCFTGSEAAYREEMGKICQAARETGTPLEINLLGLRDKRTYPEPIFWELAAREGCRVVLGCDAHDPKDVARPENVAEGYALARRFGLEPEGTVDLLPPF